ncbi:hypothetical protein [Paenibacillus sp.]|uniref:hypothetical protein n=1 Tax=Paenibacillus sp. TaxID=58172 RepID=UPI002D653544|nr:hypothetical protein [Paenibacillus sp.]HZG88378.1 hypothetical protein [Paenibacillus sp.]
MTRVTKRALWGYSPKSVEDAIEQSKQSHEALNSGLVTQLQTLERECAELRAEIDRMRAELAAPERGDALAKELLEEHMAATMQVQEATERYEAAMAKHRELETLLLERQQSMVSDMRKRLQDVAEKAEQRSKEEE